MTILGIDPGASGGIAVLNGSEEPIAHKMPATVRDAWELLAGSDPGVAVIEKVGATPQMGTVSAFKFGHSAGVVQALAIAAGLRVVMVSPQNWQRELGLIVKGRGLGQGDTAKKNRNKARAQELFPSLRITHAIADALLLAEYGRRTESEVMPAQAPPAVPSRNETIIEQLLSEACC